jgi:hypothetical protein
MKIDKPQVAGYGLHYHANNQLITNTSDRVLFQCLIDLVREQLRKSLDDQTIFISTSRLAQFTGLNRNRTIPACIERLEAMSLIKHHNNAITVNCDEYVTAIQYYESLDRAERIAFAKDFTDEGCAIFAKYGICAILHSRAELLNVSGSSITVQNPNVCKNAQLSETDSQNCAKMHNFGLQNSETVQKCTPDLCKNAQFSDSEVEICAKMHRSPEGIYYVIDEQTCAFLHNLAESIAQFVHFCNSFCDFVQFCTGLDMSNLTEQDLEAIEYAFLTGKVPNQVENELKNLCIFAHPTCAFLHTFTPKTCAFLHTSNNIYNVKRNKGGEENFQEEKKEEVLKGFEGFGKVEVLNLDEPSEEVKENFQAEVDEHSQQVLKRAERSLRAKNSYRNKPFLKVEKIKEIVECLDEVVKSPVDFFLYQFWWGIFDLYCDHYQPSLKIDEEGEVEDEPQVCDWKEMIGAPLPQDEIYQLVKNVYEDLLGAVEQGRYVYGDHNEWEVKFSFSSFEDFNPYEIFQWTPCTMQDKSIPALKIAIDKFYNIEAKDVYTPGKEDKKVKTGYNKKLANLLLASDINTSSLTPMEAAVRNFYDTFVVLGEDNVINEFTDGKGTSLESGGGLPDHLLKPWCYSLPSVGYNEFTSVLSTKYKPIEGIHKKAFIFSAEAIVEWNERNGYLSSLSHEALQ